MVSAQSCSSREKSKLGKKNYFAPEMGDNISHKTKNLQGTYSSVSYSLESAFGACLYNAI